MPSPWPLADDLRLSQGASMATVHVHSRVAVTPIVPDPPSGGIVGSPMFSVSAQRPCGVGAVVVVDDEPQPAFVANATRTTSSAV